MSAGVGTPPVAAYFHALTRAVEEPDDQKLFDAALAAYATLTATEEQEAGYLIAKSRARANKHLAICMYQTETARAVEREPSLTKPPSD